MTGRRRVAVVIGVAALAAMVGYVIVLKSAPPPREKRVAVADQWSSLAADDALVTDPTTHLTPDQIAFLRQVATRTWSLVSGPGVNPDTHLPRNSVRLAGNAGTDVTLAPPDAADEYTNPAVIGNWLTAIVAARDLGLTTADRAQDQAATTLQQIQKLSKYQGFLYRWYDTRTGVARASPQGDEVPVGYVSTVDNGWLAQGMLVAAGAFPRLAPEFDALLDAMRWQLLYDATDNVLYNGYQDGKGYSNATYDNAYSGPRIADDMAIGSGKVPGALWWGPARTPPAGHRQRQAPRGRTQRYTDPQNHRTYAVFEGHYTYDHIKFVPTFDGSLYQALAPELVIPEQTMAPDSLGLNDRNTALAQGAYGMLAARSPVWGWAPATSPPAGRYTNYGAADLSIDQGAVSHAVASPYAAFLALPVIPDQAYANIAHLVATYPASYTRFGFLDSVDLGTGIVATDFRPVSQMTILMAIDDAVDHDQLQSYLGTSAYARTLAPYLRMERYSIQGLAS